MEAKDNEFLSKLNSNLENRKKIELMKTKEREI